VLAYNERKASIGSSREARIAGYIPKTTPILAEMIKGANNVVAETTRGIPKA